jgi:hypothetical protein
MTKPIIRIHNIASDEIIDREMTDVEYEQWKKDKAEEEKKAAEALQLEELKKQAAVKLEALGITADDLKALGLG